MGRILQQTKWIDGKLYNRLLTYPSIGEAKANQRKGDRRIGRTLFAPHPIFGR